MLPSLVEKTKQLYVLLALAKCYFVIASFDLWMSKDAYDVFTLVINFSRNDLYPEHVTIGLFEATSTIGQGLVQILIKLLDKYAL
jgi:hypothetical protein